MAQIYKTFEENLNDLTTPQPRETTYSTGGTQPTAVAGVSDTAPATTAQTADQNTTPTYQSQPTQSYDAPTTGRVELPSYNPTEIQGAFANLFNPVQQKIKTGYGALGGATQEFNTGVGASRNWAGIGGEGILDKALTSGAQPDLDAARGLYNASYTGPTGLSQDALNEAYGAYSTAKPGGKGLTSASTVQALMTGNDAYKRLTRGEVRNEAGEVWKNPEFMGTASSIQKELQDYYGNLQRVQGEAGALAGKRKGEEADIAQQAATSLGTRYSGKEAELGGKVTAAQKMEDDQKAALQAFYGMDAKDMGSWNEQLGALSKVPGLDFNPEQFRTDPVKKLDEGLKIRGQIMAKYPELEGIPLMERSNNSKGKETWRFPADWFAANESKYTKQQMADLKNLARLRNIELVQAGFSSNLEQVPEGMSTKGSAKKTPLDEVHGVDLETDIPLVGDIPDPIDVVKSVVQNIFPFTKGNLPGVNTPYFDVGQYGQVLPLYNYNDWNPTEFETSVNRVEGSMLDPWSVASNEDYDYLNAIRQIRDEATLENQPDYVAPKVTANMDQYLGSQKSDLDQRARLIQDAYMQKYGEPAFMQGNQPYLPPGSTELLKPGVDQVKIDPRVYAYIMGNKQGGEGVYNESVDALNMKDFLERGGF